jgi:tetratricopeptide (TPR) repeat protein
MGKASRKKKLQKIEKVDTVPGGENRSPGFPWWLIAALCFVAFLAYAPSLSYNFVYDDDAQVLRNPWIRDWSQVGNFFFTDVWRFSNETTGNYYRPLHMVAHALGHTLSGLKPFGYHLINILLHCASTLLLSLFGYRLTRDKRISAAGGFLFALHPIHVESVAWIAGVTDPLCAVFYFGALYLYLNQDPLKSRKAVLLTSLLFLGALFSKEMAFTLPLVVVWLDYCLGGKLRWGRYAALVATFGIYTVFRVQALSQFQIKQVPLDLNLHDRFLSSIVLMGQYLAKAFIPFDVNAFHVFHPTTTLADPRFVLAVLAILALVFGAWCFRKDRRMLFLFGFIPIVLLPLMNITGVGTNIFADRYLYIPSLGSCLLIPLIAQHAWRWKPAGFRVSGQKAAVASLIGLCLVFAFMLWKTEFMWCDNVTLYTETMKRSPDSPVMAGNLARYYFEKGQEKEAAYWLSRTQENWKRSFIKNDAELCANYVRSSAICLKEGKLSEALQYLEKGYQLNPQNPAVLQNIGTIFVIMKDYAKARKWCEDSLRINPRNEISYNNLAYIFLQEKDSDKAIEYARKALEIFPKYGDAYLNLARGYAGKGLADEAAEAYRNAKLFNPLLKPTVDEELNALGAGKRSK